MAIQAMNASLKFNRYQMPKRKKPKRRLGGYKLNKKTEYNLPKANAKHLRDIKKRMQNERKVWLVKLIGVTLIMSSLLIGLVIIMNNLNF